MDMRLDRNAVYVAVALCLIGGSGPRAQGQFGGTPTKAPATLVSSVEAVVPGEPFDVALHFKCADGWHIYWKNSGDSGRAPKVDWQLPAGFEAGPLQYPVPKEYTQAGITTNILEGEPILVARVTPRADIAEKKVTIGAKLLTLVCAETCVPERDTLSLSLPVASPGDEAKPANEELFAKAERAFPKSQSKYVKITPEVVADGFDAGADFEVQLKVKIARGNHIQSNQPLQPAFIATKVFMEPTPGVLLSEPEFPRHKLRNVQFVGKVAEFGGTIIIKVPGKVDDKPLDLPARFAGIMTFQACNDKGTCFPPETIEFATTVEPTGGAVAGDAEETAGDTELAQANDGGADDAAPRDDDVDDSGSEKAADTAVALEDDAPAASPPASSTDPSTDGDAAATEPAETAGAGAGGLEAFLLSFGLPGILIGCFLFGLVINATPCVLPVLSIKVLGFVQQSHESRSRTIGLGFAFGVGVMLLFVILGFVAASGNNVLQNPVAVIVLGTVVMALALNMLGVYTLNVPSSASKLDAQIHKEGMLASFGKGALAPVLGLACVGPFMASMFAIATRLESGPAFLAFLFTGIGMASPYVLLSIFPNWLSFLPKPGQWMITFERIMGFLLLGMVILLLHPLTVQLGVAGFEWTLGFLVVVAMACWLIGQIQGNTSPAKRWRYRVGAAGMVASSALVIYGWVLIEPEVKIEWQPWSREAVVQAVESGNTVFVDFTAAYCTNCKINKSVAIEREESARKMQDLGVVAFRGDFTNGDPAIAEILDQFDRPGVPLNLIYPAGQVGNPIVLPPLISKDLLLSKLEEAGPSRDAKLLAANR